MPGVPFCLFGFSRIEESHAPLCTVCVPVCPAYTGPSAQRCASLRRHLCEQCLVQGHSTGREASCSCHSLAVSWLGCHLQGAGAGHSLSAHSWRALGTCPSLPLGGWAAGNSCSTNSISSWSTTLTSLLEGTTTPAAGRNFKTSVHLPERLSTYPVLQLLSLLLILGLS